MTKPAQDPLGLVGTTLEGKYRIEGVVGEGGFAIVYRATHLVWQRPVAVKAFRALADLDDAHREKLVAEFVREGALLAELSERSAAIVQARDVGTVTTAKGEHVPYMILEWLDGRTLEALVDGDRAAGVAPRPLDVVVKLLDPVAEALALAHKKGIAHRDVKPGNVFILGDPNGEHTVKLLDFGIAKVVQDAQKESGSFTKTGGNVTSFTPAYGAPEQFSRAHGATGPWTDVFALALVAVELLTLQAPLEGDTFVQLGYASGDEKRRPTPRALGAVVPDGVEAVFAKALAVAPDKRWPTAGDFWNALRAALAMAPMRVGLSTTDPTSRGSSEPLSTAKTVAVESGSSIPAASRTTDPKRPEPKSRAGLFVGLGLAAAAVAAIVVFELAGHKGGDATASTVTSASAVAPPPPKAPECPAGAVMVTGGKFFMGADHPPKDYLSNEKPAHQVTLSTYCIDKLEVTTEQYKDCTTKGECLRADETNQDETMSKAQHEAYDPLCNVRDPVGRAKHPINCVDWSQAQKYCTAHGGRLPSEAEWEFAARGSDGRLYPWGDDAPAKGHANACGTECIAWAKKHKVADDFPGTMFADSDGFDTTAPVGSFPAGASKVGALDMVGNVWEWTADWYAPYEAVERTDPKGPEKGDERVIRGGGWNGAFPEWARPTFRFRAPPTNRTHGIGFRCAYTPK